MSGTLEILIIFAFVLNIIGFVVYALNLKQKKEKKEKVIASGVTEELETAEEQEDDYYIDEVIEEPVYVKKEKKITKREPIVMKPTQKEQDEKLTNLIQELKEIREEKEEPIVEEEKIVKQEKQYETEYATDIKYEKEEIKQLYDDEEEDADPLELLEEILEEPKKEVRDLPEYDFLEEDKKEEEKKEEPKKEEVIESTEEEKPKKKRQMVDAINILKVEGEDEPEGRHDELVIRHYEPMVYENLKDEEEVYEEEEEDENIEKRIAYLTGEWTEDYAISKKKNIRKEK